MRIKIEQLIQEIKKRRPLYDSTLHDYHVRTVKRTLWEEVCEAVFTVSKWNALSETEQDLWRKEVLKKWNSLRDCFRRELRMQENPIFQSAENKKKRKYYYYDSLLFLAPFSQGGHKVPTEVYLENPVVEEVIKLEEMSPPPEEFDSDPENEPKRKKRDEDVFSEPKTDSVASYGDPNSRLEIISNVSYTGEENREKVKTTKIDEDEAFFQSLLPTFRELKTDQKFQLRIEVMQTVLNFIKKNKNES